jgi:DNA repair protein RadC
MAYLRHSMENLPREVFKVIFLDSSNVVISVDELSTGTVTAAYLHARTFLEKAIEYNSTYMVLAHNHPSGKTVPSEDDQKLTRRLVHVAYVAEMVVLDHLIIGKDGEYFSFRDQGLISLYEGEVRETYQSQPMANGGLLHEHNPVTYTEIRRKKTKPGTMAASVIGDESRTVHEA